MKITFHGESCFTLEHNKTKIVLSPYSKEIGLAEPKLEGNIVLVARENDPAYNNSKSVAGDPIVFDWPGEYEANDISIQGISAYNFSKEDGEEDTGETTLFVIRFEDFSLAHLGGLGHRMPSRLIDKIGDIDILFVPVGGKGSINAKKAEEVVSQLEPRVAIPMHYAEEGKKEALAPMADFLKETGASAIEPKDIYEPKKSDLNTEKTEIVVLNAQR